MKTNYHHITVGGEPLCQAEGHLGGLMAGRYDHNGESLRFTCAFRSMARARSAYRELRRFYIAGDLAIIPGQCPSAGGQS